MNWWSWRTRSTGLWLDEQLAESFSDQGRPAEPVRFMIGMFLLKHTYALSDEQVWDRWVHDPYFQYFTGEEFFQHVNWCTSAPE